MFKHSCVSCGSGNQREFAAEMNIHFPYIKGLEVIKGLDVPSVWIFPRLLVCMNCGSAQLTIPEAELKTLADRDWRSEKAVG